MAKPTINAMFSFDTKVVVMLNIKNATPPKIKGLNFINNPVVVVAIPAINIIIAGGSMSNLKQRNIATKNPAAVTYQRFFI